jgi:hypothetical protein
MADALNITSYDELIATVPHTLGFKLSWTTVVQSDFSGSSVLA